MSSLDKKGYWPPNAFHPTINFIQLSIILNICYENPTAQKI